MSLALAAFAPLAATSSAAAAPSAPIWGPTVAYGEWRALGAPLTHFRGTSCPSEGNCVAVGVTQPTSGSKAAEHTPVFAVESDETWSPTIAVALPALTGGQLDSVSCVDATSCVAVGERTTEEGEGGPIRITPLIVPISLSSGVGTAGAPVSLTLPSDGDPLRAAQLEDVSCGSVSHCTAIGTYQDTGGKAELMTAVESGVGTWNAIGPVAAPAAAQTYVFLEAISCPSSGPCEAVGTYYDSSTHLYSWAVSVTDGIADQGVTVTMPPGFVPAEVETGLETISCPSAGVCTAAGGYPYTAAASGFAPVAVPIVNGTPGTAVKLAISSAAPAEEPERASVARISCSDAVDCTVAGNLQRAFTPVVGAETGGSWSALSPLTIISTTTLGVGEVTALSCTSATDCLVSGIQDAVTPAREFQTSTYFAVSSGPLSVTTTSLPGATVGQPYSAALQTSSRRDNSWSITSGSLPAGLSLDASTGVISGTPTTAGQAGFAATASSPELAQTATASLSIAVAVAGGEDGGGGGGGSTMTPPATPTSTVKIISLKRAGAKVKVTLGCSAACSGALKLTAVESLKPKTASAAASAKKKTKKTITVATGPYSLSASSFKAVILVSSKAAGGLLKSAHKVHGTLTATPTGAKQPAASKNVTF